MRAWHWLIVVAVVGLGLSACVDGGNKDGGPDEDAGGPVCGDGILEGDEECDDGNTDNGDGCDENCALEPVECGDGLVGGDEECDDGDDNSDTEPDACRTDCTDPICGDGVIDTNEFCDDGDDNSDTEPDACRVDCTAASCGDGVIDTDETCDDGDDNSDTVVDACRTTCEPAGCGDGVIDTDETCDDGDDNSDTEVDACRTTCEPASCGDGVTDTGEDCDDSGESETCNVDCTTASCGDSKVNLTAGEECDPPDGSTCDAECLLILCGNGVIDPPFEECDDGEDNSDTEADACRTNCRNPSCGDDVIDTGETCDDGGDNSDTEADACRTTCDPASCGDDVIDTGEDCDDGDDNSDTEPDACRTSCDAAACGDDVVDTGEDCDGTANCQGLSDASPCEFITRAFRMNSLGLTDPVIHLNGPVSVSCNEGLHPLVVTALSNSTREDRGSDFAPIESLDGLVDLGFVFTFTPLDKSNAAETDGAFILSDCDRISKPSPVPPEPNPTPCAPTITQDPPYEVTFDAVSQTSGTCLEALPGTVTSFPPNPPHVVNPVVAGDDGCWVSDPFVFQVILGSVVQFPLEDTRIATNWTPDPTTGLINGLIRGFISQELADTVLIDPGTLFIGGQTLTQSFFPEGAADGPCDPRDTGPGGVIGFYVYLPFTAEAVPWEGGLMCGNGVLDTGGAERDETCDTGIASGPGSCTALLDCDDGFVCTQDTNNAGDSCAPTCFHRGFNDNGDSCCPAAAPAVDVFTGGNPADDADCSALCGDGTVQDWEDCDTAGTGGDLCDADPAVQCDDGEVCTTDTYRTNNACVCQNTTIVARIPGDGCCPAVCSNPSPPANCATDTDCD